MELSYLNDENLKQNQHYVYIFILFLLKYIIRDKLHNFMKTIQIFCNR